jgi:hemerythrin-like domain-containing protein
MIQIQNQIAPPVTEGPIEHLLACHRRIEDRLAILERAGQHLEDRPEESLLAISNSLRFLDTSGVLHTVDEEESVFPRLRGCLAADEITYLDTLESQHREVDVVYASLKQIVNQLQQQRTPERLASYRELVAKLTAAYRAHIASEDSVLMDMARRTLTPSQLSEIKTEMRARR